ncbi:MgtE intracellular region [Syntrophobotulus glycolicus DSM 8271]|uniref:MgtE intracellular region n=1 Tax=Syntrophobotulus glycolicus (strain DSM 8271 / FlGlyR) TaxID=645991 RepID=F0SUV1_SYNGF|nr:CBS domain-containing protein [Syntrophobotulus glycolicus]ADY56667.1 MgtE intracellular region [Syntrophobotulus glycolicus DSM 8271]
MAKFLTFYLSRILGNRVITQDNQVLGQIKDLIADLDEVRPKIVAAKLGNGRILDFSFLEIDKNKGQYAFRCRQVRDYTEAGTNQLFLNKNIMDKQIVDIDGRKIVRVNDLRLAVLSNGTYLIAVDVGLEGLLRRLGVAKPIKKGLRSLGISLSGRYILWEDVEAVPSGNTGIKLSKPYTKLSTLHPSDFADIIEDLDRYTQVEVFSSLDEDRAAEVLEELESEAQVNVLEGLSISRAADVLEKMPADEAADILEKIDDHKAEEILNEMEKETSEEIRELMEYPENSVGALMTTDYISFKKEMSVNEVLKELRSIKPEIDTIYSLYIVDEAGKLTGAVSLRDIVVSEPETILQDIMDAKVLFVYDLDEIDLLNEIVSKYSLLAVPVVDKEKETLLGMVIIDDIMTNLLKVRRKKYSRR